MAATGPCEAAVSAGLLLLAKWSGALVQPKAPGSPPAATPLEEEAFRCRHAGNRYFVGSMGDGATPTGSLAGLCLPPACTTATDVDIIAASSKLLGRPSAQVVPYTTLLGLREGLPGFTAVRSGGTSEQPATTWYDFSLLQLLVGLPAELAETRAIAVTFKQFRGTLSEYKKLVVAVATTLGRVLGKITVVAAGDQRSTAVLWGDVRIRWRMERPFCRDITNWLAIPGESDVKYGLAMTIPPMWKVLVAPDFGGAPPAGTRAFTDVSIDTNIQSELMLHVCEEPPEVIHLQWTLPSDSVPAAKRLVARGTCANAVARRLPELVSSSVFVAGSAAIVFVSSAEPACI
eukprot:TRINITY_DN4373_c0_g1_i4.p1 TRINITY_DN4373_c0_g1~~TRINITY_DN4373_c0_g1_i4.p1  ORF type:complete len:346 (-),score=41.05 TRINITY_DN4373_c0_g1_i4:345-1382(-)